MSVNDGRIISIENFDQTSRKEPIINSPRSLEACKRQGIDPSELIIRSFNEIKEMYKGKILDKEGLELMAKHYEERRKEKIRVLKEERLQLIQDEKNGNISFPNIDVKDKSNRSLENTMQAKSKTHSGSMMNTGVNSTLIEREKKQLEKIRAKQEKEMKNMIEYENKMAMIQRAQEEKLEKQRQKEREREIEVAKRRKQEEERKRQIELEKQKKAEEEEEKARQLAAETNRREQERIEMEKEKERQRLQEAKRREEEQKRRNEEFARQTEEKLQQQQLLILKKKEEMEEKDKIRQEFLRKQAEMKAREAEEQRRQLEEKLRQTKEKNDAILKQKQDEFLKREAEAEERKRMFELETEQKREEARRQAQLHQQTIQKVIEENEKINQKRKEDFYMKKALAEERKKELEAIQEQERQKRIQEEKEKEEQRKHVKQNMEERMTMRVTGFLNKQREAEEKLERAQKQKEDDLRARHNLDVIKRNDRVENVKRIQKMQDYQKEKLMEKIMSDTEKAQKIKEERNNLLEMRREMKRKMESEKRQLMTEFEKVKQGKANLESLSVEFPQNESMMGGTEAINRNTQSQKNISTKAKTADASKREQKKEKKITPQQSIDVSASAMNSVNEKEARKAIENLKLKQNHEMLVVLEEEQAKENQREAKLNTITDPQEKKRLEKIYAMERAKAHARVQQMTDAHDEAVKQLMAKYNLKSIY